MNDVPQVYGPDLPTGKGTRRSQWDEAVALARKNPGEWILANDDCSISVVYHLRNGKFPATAQLDRSKWEFVARRDDERHTKNRCSVFLRLKPGETE